MLREISKEVAGAIHNNHTAVLSIIGTICGYVANFTLERIRQGGRVKLTCLELHPKVETVVVGGKDSPALSFQLHYRVLNSYPIPKSISVVGAEVLPHVPRWWSRFKPLPLNVEHMQVGTEYGQQKFNSDVQCEAHFFTRLWISGHAIPQSTDYEAIRRDIGCAIGIRVNLLISPNKRVWEWHRLDTNRLRQEVERWMPKIRGP
jgi:hypothetical protein